MCALVVLAGCSDSSSTASGTTPSGSGPSVTGSASSGSASSGPVALPDAQTAIEKRCGTDAPDGVPQKSLTVRSTDGVRLRAVELGRGPRGVVLLHQTGEIGLCGWWRYAGHLAEGGFHVVAYDLRCRGESSCPEGKIRPGAISDTRAVVGTLRDRGARKVALVGASYGGAIAIGAASEVKVDAAVALSAAFYDLDLGGGQTARKAVAKVRVPVLFAVSPDDPDSPIRTDRYVLSRARRGIVTFTELPAGVGHGWDVVARSDGSGEWSAFSAELIDFLGEQLG
jgi:pimeloyl-ACP methyl ester carboxylesterase